VPFRVFSLLKNPFWMGQGTTNSCLFSPTDPTDLTDPTDPSDPSDPSEKTIDQIINPRAISSVKATNL